MTMANVLIVEDDRDVADASRELLESAGHKVHVAHSGVEGMASLSTAPLPECILLDVEMPMLSGPQMAHQMLLRDSGTELIPILLVSGRDDLPEVAAQMGTPYFLKKAATNYSKSLLQILHRALSERRAPLSA
jgi:FixJ family two-component response regulator